MAKPAARVTDPTACPEPGHGENPITSGSPDVLFEGLPAAREGDTTECGSRLTSGLSSSVFINGKRAAMVGSAGDHGNSVVSGASSIIIGDTFTPAPFIAPKPIDIGFAKSFLVTDSNTGAPLERREYIAKVGDEIVEGRTDSLGFPRQQGEGKICPGNLGLQIVEQLRRELSLSAPSEI